MIQKQVFTYWVQLSDIHDQIKAIDGDRIAAAKRRFTNLLSIQSADEVRMTLADNPSIDNSDLVWYILHLLREVDFDGTVEGNAVDLIEWELLIANYAEDSKLLRAHGTLLKGIFFHKAKRFADARDAYRESVIAHEALYDRADLLSICTFCVGKLNADLDDIDEAYIHFEKALSLTDKDAPDSAAWFRLVVSQQDRSRKQNDFVNQLIELQASEERHVLLERNKQLIDDDFVEMLKSRAKRLAVNGKYEEAGNVAALVDFVHIYRGNKAEFQIELVHYYLSGNMFQQAEELLKIVLNNNPNDEELEFWLAHSLLQQAKFDEGKHVLETIIQNNPDHSDAHSYLGQMYVLEEKWGEAQRHLKIALNLNPDDAMARQALDAIPKASVSYDPKCKSIAIGGDMMSSSPEDLAEAFMVAIVAGNPDRADELLKSIADEKGEEVAKRVASKALVASGRQSRFVGEAQTHFIKAEQLFADRQFKEAIEEYKKTIEAEPNNARAYMGLGDCYYIMGDFNLAASYFEESVAIEPVASTYRYLGDAYMGKGQLDKAINAYQSAVDTDPNYEPAKIVLRKALERKKSD